MLSVPRGPAIRFRIFDTPVRIGLSFPIVIVALPLLVGGDLGRTPWMLGSWLALVTVSVLIHEAGHVAALRACGFHPEISLNALGGLTSTDEPGTLSPWRSIGVSLAGPAAAVLLGLTINSALIPIHGREVEWFRSAAWFVNIWWSAFNLLPIVPLDGGHVTREFVEMASRRRGGALWWLAAVTVAICGVTWWQFGDDYPLVVAGALALMILTNIRSLAITRDQLKRQEIDIAHEQLMEGNLRDGLRTLLPILDSRDSWMVSTGAYTTVGWALLHERRFEELARLDLDRLHERHRPLLVAAIQWYRGDLTTAMGLVTESLATGAVEIPDEYFNRTFGRLGELDLLARYVQTLPDGAAYTIGKRLHDRVLASASAG